MSVLTHPHAYFVSQKQCISAYHVTQIIPCVFIPPPPQKKNFSCYIDLNIPSSHPCQKLISTLAAPADVQESKIPSSTNSDASVSKFSRKINLQSLTNGSFCIDLFIKTPGSGSNSVKVFPMLLFTHMIERHVRTMAYLRLVDFILL